MIQKEETTTTNSPRKDAKWYLISKSKQRLTMLTKAVTVEPLLFLYQMSKTIVKPALDNLELEKTCRVNLKLNNSICDIILSGSHSNYTEENDNIQMIISNMHSWQQPIQSFIPLIIVLFAGSFSDRHNLRKPFLLLPIVGDIVGLLGCFLCVVNMKLWPVEVQGVAQSVIPSIFGGAVVLIMYSTAHIAHTTSLEMRTMRMGLMQILMSIVGPLGNSFCGNFFLAVGYFGVFATAIVLLLIAFVYGIVCVKEKNKQPQISVAQEEEKGAKNSKICLIMDLFNPQHAIDTFTIITRKKAGISRGYAVAMVLMIFLHRSAFDGESSVLFLYTQNVFQWTPVEFSYFLMVNGFILMIGNIFGVPLYTRIFHISDIAILSSSVLMKILTNILFGLARSPTIFYVGVTVSILTRMFRVAKRSLATKIVSEADIAKMQALIGIFEIIAPAISVPIYNVIYMYTLMDYPYCFFFFSIILYTACCLLIGYMSFQEKRKIKIQQRTSQDIPSIEGAVSYI